MASKLLSKDQQNFVKLGIVCMDEIKLVLKDVFESQIKPVDLYNAINSCSELTTGRHRLRLDQLRLCRLSPPQLPVYDQFDVSLLYTLIRNLCPNLKPTKGWGKTPDSGATKIGDDIECFRIFRNDTFAHIESSEVPDGMFVSRWNDLKGNIQRAQKFVTSLGYKVNYEEKLAKIEKSDFGCKDMEKYKVFLEGMMIMWKHSQNIVIKINGNSKILCGEKACFEVETENWLHTDNWPVKWVKERGDTTKAIDISKEKYNGSTSRILVIQRVKKEDQGEYQAVISREIDRRHFKVLINSIFLEAIGDLPNLQIIQATSGIDSVTIFYNCDAEKVVPSLQKVEWSKDGKRFTTNTNKYEGGGVTDRYLKILSPSENDSGEYTCEVFNAVGSVSKVISLGIILTATFGDQITVDSIIESCPSPEKAIWQKSKDLAPDNFMTIDIDDARYFGSSLDPEKPILVITKASDADKMYYQLEVTNGIGKSISNAVLLKLVGGTPKVLISSYEKDIETDRIICEVTIESFPGALKAEWRVQQTIEDDFQPTDIHDSTYTGSTVSLPHPVLIVHGFNKKQGQRFQIRVTNFIGEISEVIYDKQMDFYRKRGSKIPFASLRDDLENSFPQNELERFKHLLIDQDAIIEDSVSACNSLREVLGILIQEGLFSIRDVILVQYLLRKIGCLELYDKCYDYAQACGALCFYERQPENGFTTVKFHISGNFKDYSKEDIYFIRDTVAKMVNCPEADVFISGLQPDKSFVVLLSIKEEYTNALLSHAQDILERLHSLNVDYLVCDEFVFRKGHISKEQDMELDKWRDEDRLYQETHGFHEMMKKVRKQRCVTFVGCPGSGKTATAHHIAFMLQKEGYEVVPIKDIREIIEMEELEETYNQQVFIVDDVVGVFGLQRTKLDYLAYLLTDYKYEMASPSIFRCKTLLTCREAVYNESLSYNLSFRWYESVIKLHSSEYVLDDNDKKLIMKKYGLKSELLSPSLLTSASSMFPLLCKLFSKEEKFRNFGSTFFTNPVRCIIIELDEMQRKNKLYYATLALCIMNEKLSEGILRDQENTIFLDIKNSVLKNLELQTCISTSKFVDALSAMEGIYTKKSGTEYTFIHDYVYEICAYHYGQQFPGQMLQYMSSSYIANKVKLQKSEANKVYKSEEREVVTHSDKNDERSNKNDAKSNETEESFDLCIRLSEEQYPLLAERLYRDIERMKLHDVFTNGVLKHPKVSQAFIGVLEEKSYNEIKSLFLYERLHSRNLERYFHNLMRMHEVNLKVIAWVILHGHYNILQYIVGEIEKHGENKSELFYRDFEHLRCLAVFLEGGIHYEDILLNEEKYMLLLSCYSGNLETVKIVLKCVSKDSIKNPIQREYWETTKLLNSPINLKTSWKCTPLLAACEEGHLNIVHELIKAEASVNLADGKGRTALITACDGGHLSIVQELLKVGADVNVSDTEGNTPLTTAFKRGHFDIMQELIKTGADVNLPSEKGCIALITACMGGDLSIVQDLIKAGADVNIQDKERKVALVTALMSGHLSFVHELIKAGASVNLADGKGRTALITACDGGHLSIVQELLKVGADVNVSDIEGNTPLTTAMERGHFDIMQELIKIGADVNLPRENGRIAVIIASEGGHLSFVQDLIKAGADVNIRDKEGKVALVTALMKGHLSIVQELIKIGANVNIRNQEQNTALITALKRGYLNIVQDLIKAGADVNLQNKEGNTPLITACEGGYLSMVQELIKKGAKVNLQNIMGNTPLVAACIGGYMGIVQELFKVRADINHIGMVRNTPLVAACRYGHLSIVQELIKMGADVNLQDNEGCTPLIAARKGKHLSIVKELTKMGADVN
ncbi:uncharacterized protein LOC133205132 [Saccostrea echinata]|uniref:uncharacterized protein LOC133205132 n=1 Tax=Saccostrea echinata TaxID=191078 RepID=UPI002A829009|nr:uncharacterized protein LOC133205132 [Saccostrea echinata]